jgi:putative peptide zinc metalloprotease protein
MRRVGNNNDSATERPVGLRRRPDLLIEPHSYGREQYWLVKDPVSARYFHLPAEEHAILNMLDGQISLGQLKRRFEKTFAPLQITIEQLYAFLGRLHSLGLLLADSIGQGEQLLERRSANQRRSRLVALGNVLAIRFPGVDPDRLLRWLYPKCKWIFSTWCLMAGLAVVLSAIGLATFQFSLLQRKLPDLHAFMTPHGLAWLLAALALVKIVHELAHALTCIHVGGQCHEIGLLLLVFTPCLYCDVSDVWSISDKWRRIAVSAAGIVVEIFLAAVATFLWWFTAPGAMNTLCLNVMIVCSVSTLLLNGNPLLRYDGYYVLGDWLEIPNLAQQSQALLGRLATRCFLGMAPPADRSLPPARGTWCPLRVWLVAYAAASILYRWAIVFGILWFCYRVAKGYGAEVIAAGLAMLVVAGMVIAPMRRLAVFFDSQARHRKIRWLRTWFVAGLAVAAVLFLLAVPLPYHVVAPALFEPQDARMVYVTVPGRIIEMVTPGEAVREGQVLAWLVNLDVDREIVELSGQCKQQRLQLENDKLRLIDDPQVAAEIPRAESTLADLEARLQQRQRDRESLTLRAPCNGVILPAPIQRDAGYPLGGGRRQLHAWQGTPLDKRNAGCILEKGALLCVVGPPNSQEALAVVDQEDVNFLGKGQKVRLMVAEAPGQVLTGTVVELADLDLKVVPHELVKGSEIAVRTDEKGVSRPAAPSYQARIAIDPPAADHGYMVPALLAGTRGRAKIAVEPQSLAQRFLRFLQQTFNVRS